MIKIDIKHIPIDYMATELFNIGLLVGYGIFYMVLLFIIYETFTTIKKIRKDLKWKKNM